jgi:ABC-type transport system involved in multi-copper enzyme maturation permease subunit
MAARARRIVCLLSDSIAAVAGVELRALLRAHPFRIFLPAAALLVIGSPSLVLFGFEQKPALAVQMGLSTATAFAALAGLLAGTLSASRDRQRGLTDLLFARSLRPGALILGKWLGIVAAIVLAVGALALVHGVATAVRGGPPAGYAPFLAAVGLAVLSGALAAAAALLFGTRLPAGAAFAAALLLLLAGHAAALLGGSLPAAILRFLLPRMGLLNLSAKGAFGPVGFPLFALAVLHGLLYTVALLALTTALLSGRRRGDGQTVILDAGAAPP